MESDGTEFTTKRMKPFIRLFVEEEEHGAITDSIGKETETGGPVSQETALRMAEIREKIDRFTQQVSELLESGKSFLKELSNEFEERVILIHQEHMEKWQEELKELCLLDTYNEEINTLLQNAQYLLQNFHEDS